MGGGGCNFPLPYPRWRKNKIFLRVMNANGEMEDEVTNNKIEDLFAEPEFDEDDAGQGQFEKKGKYILSLISQKCILLLCI